jgi:hypothetical protein
MARARPDLSSGTHQEPAMSHAARQLAPFLSLRPHRTRTLYLLLVRVRRVAVDFEHTHVIPELDDLIDRTITQSHHERAWADATPAPSDPRAIELAAAFAPHLLSMHRRLSEHGAHPGIAALKQRLFPHGLGHALSLSPAELVHEVDRLLTTLLSAVHTPYTETAGLSATVRALVEALATLRKHLEATASPTLDSLEACRIDLHHDLGLLFVRLFAACWSDSAEHAACRGRLLNVWATCDARSLPVAPPTSTASVRAIGHPPPVRVRVPA